MTEQKQLIDAIYRDLTELLAGNPRAFLDRWHKHGQTSLMLTLGEREFGWEKVSTMLKQVSTVIGKAPVKSRVVPHLDQWCECGSMAYAVILEDVEALLENQPPQTAHQQRCTMIFEKCHGTWKIVHTHVDMLSPLQATLSFILRHPHFDLEPDPV